MSNIIDKVKAKVDDVLHKDKDTTTTTHTGTHAGTHHAHTTGTHTSGNDPTGPHSSHLANKADPRVDSDIPGGHGNTRSAGGYAGSDPTGPHQSHLANKADPRVDSDQLGNRGNASSVGGPGYSGSDPTGPHDSRLANKIDPRVDSDTVGSYGNTGSARGTGHTTGYGSDPTGPHDSHIANRADPRVDSSHVGGLGNTPSTGGPHAGHGLSGTTSTTGYGSSDPTGPHDSRLANKADPRVDSDHVGSYGNTGSASTTHHGSQFAGTGTGNQNVLGSGPGPAPNTAGPHGNDMLNKLDPRVDSDLDGSKTYGGNKTSGY